MVAANIVASAAPSNSLDQESSLNLNENEIREVNKIKKNLLSINECQKLAQQIRIGMIKLCAQKKALYPWSEENVFGASCGAIFNKIERICKYGLKNLNTDEPAAPTPTQAQSNTEPTTTAAA